MLEETQNRLTDVAAAVADGQPLDWDAVESGSQDEAERHLVRRLRAIADIGRAHAAVTFNDSFSFLTSLRGGLDPTVGEKPPVTWGSLRILEKIGRGRFGDVYRAWDPSLDREVALKLLRHRDAAPDSTAEDQAVVEEGRLMARVRHPNVVTIFGAQRIDGRTGLWMEYVPGRTLEAEVKERGPFSAIEVAQVGIELCRALDAVHAAGLVHRDVKAQNVLRDARGHVLLGDFGTGRELDDEDSSRDIAGTPAYLAPEIFQRKPATPQSDLYSLGALLFHLATNSFPVSGRSLNDLRDAHSQGRRTPLQAVCPDLPKFLAEVIEKALDPDPSCRFADAAAMEAALAAAIAPRSTRKWLVAAGTVAITGVVMAFAVSQDGQAPWGGGGVGSAGLADDPRQARRLGDRAVWTGTDVDLFGTVSPDGRFLTYTDWNNGNLMLRDLVAGTARPLTNNVSPYESGNANWSVISRNGEQVAYVWEPARNGPIELRIASLRESGIPSFKRLVQSQGEDSIRPFDWSPDRRWIAGLREREDGSSQLGLVSVQDGSFLQLKSVDWRGVNKALFSPDGRFIAYDLVAADQRNHGRVYVMAVDGSDETAIVDDPGRNHVMGWSRDGQLLVASDRSGTLSLWSVPMENGRPRSAPVLVKADIGSSWSLGLTASGTLHIWKTAAMFVRVAPFEMGRGRLLDSSSSAFQRFIESRGRPDWSADGRHLLYMSCSPDGGGPCTLTVRSMEAGAVRDVPHGLRYLHRPRLAPDGHAIVADGTDLKGRPGIYLIDAGTGETSLLVRVETGLRLGYPDWSRDGKSIYYQHGTFQGDVVLRRRDVSSGSEREVFRATKVDVSPGGLQALGLSPDGRFVAHVKTEPGSRSSMLTATPIAGGPARPLFQAPTPFFWWQWTPDSQAVIVRREVGDDEKDEFWLVPLTGRPRKLGLDLLSRGEEGFFELHPDGRQAAIVATAGKPGAEVWALENFLQTQSGGDAASAASGDDSQLTPRLGDRAVWTGREVDMFGRVSPDGRLISYVDFVGYGDLAVHDIAANTNRRLTGKTSWPDMGGAEANYSVFSPDSQQLAYVWWGEGDTSGIRILSASSTTAAAKPRQLIRFGKDVKFAGPLDWSPDGRSIAVSLRRTDGSGEIIVASVSDGSFRVVKSMDWNAPHHIFFSRDSRYIAYDLSVSESNDQYDLYVLAIDGSQETVVAAHPANEWVIGWTPDGSHLLFSSDRTGSNGLWAVPMANGKPAGPMELLRPDIGPQAYSLGLTSSGAAVVYKGVSSRDVRVQGIDLRVGRLVGPPVSFTQGFVPGTQTPNWSADGKWLAYQACRGLSSCVVVRSVDTGEVRRFGNRVLNYGRDPRWSPDGSSLLVGSRDSRGRDGIFRFEIKTDVVRPLTYRSHNWTSPRWSADGSKIYFDNHDPQNQRIVERDLRSGAERDVFVGSLRDFEVSPDGTHLAVMTGSRFAGQDPAAKTARLIVVPVSGAPPREVMRFNDQEFPETNLTHSFAWLPDSRTILAAQRSPGRSALWLVPTGDGQPRRLDINVDEWALADPEAVSGDGSGFSLSPDGTRIAYLVGKNAVEVWALENILPGSSAQ